MALQLIITILVAVIIGRLVQNVRAHRIAVSAAFGWAVIWVSVCTVFWSPEIASKLALVFGIGRGADLVIYVAIIVIMYLVYRLFIRMEKMEHDITELTRATALRDERSRQHHTDPDR